MFGKKHPHEKSDQNNQNTDPYSLVGILENAPIGIFTSTPDGRFLFANPALAKMYGYDTPEELVHSITDFDKQLYADPADRKTFKHLLDIQGELVNFEYRLRRRDGSMYWVSTTARAVRDDSGTIIHYQGFTTDISARKKIEKKLHGTSKRLNAILDHSPLLISEFKPDGRYVAVNSATADMLGSPVSAVAGKTFQDLLPPDTAALFMDRISQVMAAGEPITVEDHARTHEKEFYLLTTLFPLFNASGRVGSIGAVSHNIIDRKKMEGTLAENEFRYQSITENSFDMISLLDLNGFFLYCNKAYEEILGYLPDQLVGRNAFDIIHPLDREAATQHFQEGVRRKKIKTKYIIRLLCKDGSQKIVEHKIKLLPDNHGEPSQLLVIAADITARHQAEIDLRQSEARFRNLLNDIPSIAVQGYTVDGIVQYWNTASENIYGYTAEEAVGRNLVDLIIPDDMQPGTQKEIQHMGSTGEPVPPSELSLKRKDGSRIWIFTSHAVVQGPGDLIEIFSVDIDLTRHKQAEQELQESESTFRLFAELAPIGIIISDQQEKIVYSSHKFFDIFGYTRQEIPRAEDWWQLAYPDQLVRKQVRQKWKEAVTEAKKNHSEIKPQEYPVTCKDGTIRHVEFRMATRGKLNAIVVIDITERKNAEKELEKREFLLNKIFNVLPIGLWFADKDGKLLRGNPAGIKIWGAEPTVSIEEYGVFKARRLPSGQVIEAEDWALAKTLKQGVTITDELLEIETFDGQKKIILNYTAPVLDNDGQSLGAIVVNNDITDRIQAEEDRERLQAQLLQAQKLESVGKLAGGVAHDYNNMLSVISGYTEIALEKITPDDPLQSDLKEIQKAARRATDITRQLLAFARKQTIRPQILDLNDTVTDMLKMFQRLIGEDIDLSWRAGKNLWAVEIDPAQIDQVLANLCVNARDAITGIGKMSIETQNVSIDETYCIDNTEGSPGHYVMLAVSDDGHGMTMETRKNIFEPFFTTKEIGEGTGLGLATVYGIVKQNNGFINVYSEVNEGTTFKIYLPRHAGKIKTPDRKEGFIDRGNGETVLIVEDESSILALLQKMLINLNYTVLAANSPVEALTLISKHPGRIDLLITDVVMPEMNGRDLVDQIHTAYPAIRILYMSGYTANVIAHRGVLDEDINFIQKPFSMKDLADKVREVLIV